MLQAASVVCPYCWEALELTVDGSGGNQVYVEDCWVCCQPIVIGVRVDHTGRLQSVDVAREND